MRTLQQIFDLMIKKGYYGKGEKASLFMCISTKRAMHDKVITYEEQRKVAKAVRHYLDTNEWSTVRGGLALWMRTSGLTTLDERAILMGIGSKWIYQNWNRRPRKTQGSYEACMRNRVLCWIADMRRAE